MNLEVARQVDFALLEECMSVLQTKGVDYSAGSDDGIWNFRAIAEDIDIPIEKAWWVYFFKHLTAVRAFVKRRRVESEPIRGRIVDCINYLLLLNRILEERERSA